MRVAILLILALGVHDTTPFSLSSPFVYQNFIYPLPLNLHFPPCTPVSCTPVALYRSHGSFRSTCEPSSPTRETWSAPSTTTGCCRAPRPCSRRRSPSYTTSGSIRQVVVGRAVFLRAVLCRCGPSRCARCCVVVGRAVARGAASLWTEPLRAVMCRCGPSRCGLVCAWFGGALARLAARLAPWC